VPARFTFDLRYFGGKRRCANDGDRQLREGRIATAETALKDLVERGCIGPFHCLSIDGNGNVVAVTLNDIGPDVYETQDIGELMPPIHVIVMITQRASLGRIRSTASR